MKKVSCIFWVFVLIFALTSCSLSANPASASPTENESAPATEAKEEKPAVHTVNEEKVLYSCEQCGGDCTYYTGYFRCPAIDRISEDALAINADIRNNYEKYVSVAHGVGESGLAYGFDFATEYADHKYVILRTAIETVLLHNGGTYSYEFYYYDLENDCKAEVADVCSYFGPDIQIIAAYLRITLSENAEYEPDQIKSITADCIDIFPTASDDSYFVRVQNDCLKYETKIKSADLNARGDEIASLMAQEQEDDQSAADENVGEETAQPTTQQDVIYIEY